LIPSEKRGKLCRDSHGISHKSGNFQAKTSAITSKEALEKKPEPFRYLEKRERKRKTPTGHRYLKVVRRKQEIQHLGRYPDKTNVVMTMDQQASTEGAQR